jgi:hypothetical protein
MQIITIENSDFPLLLDAFRAAKPVGSYAKEGSVFLVKATEHFVLIMPERQSEQIALRPVHNLHEATQHGCQLLLKEQEKGAKVEFSIASARPI